VGSGAVFAAKGVQQRTLAQLAAHNNTIATLKDRKADRLAGLGNHAGARQIRQEADEYRERSRAAREQQQQQGALRGAADPGPSGVRDAGEPGAGAGREAELAVIVASDPKKDKKKKVEKKKKSGRAGLG
jgi:hypothetical protein